MRRVLKQQYRHIWIALLAILFNALAPSITHALVQSSASSYPSDICSANAPQADTSPQSPTQLPHSMKHCLMCALHGGADGLPPGAFAALIGSGEPLLAIAPSYLAPGMRPIWDAASPRAPPASI
jgi:hypothetical protein